MLTTYIILDRLPRQWGLQCVIEIALDCVVHWFCFVYEMLAFIEFDDQYPSGLLHSCQATWLIVPALIDKFILEDVGKSIVANKHHKVWTVPENRGMNCINITFLYQGVVIKARAKHFVYWNVILIKWPTQLFSTLSMAIRLNKPLKWLWWSKYLMLWDHCIWNKRLRISDKYYNRKFMINTFDLDSKLVQLVIQQGSPSVFL